MLIIWLELNDPSLNSPRAMCVRNYLGGCGSMFIGPQHVAKLVEIIIYDRPTVDYSWIKSQSSADFMFIWAKSAKSTVCIWAQQCCDINCTRPCFVSTLSTCMLAHSEINSTCGKNSRKYSILSVLNLPIYPSFQNFNVQNCWRLWVSSLLMHKFCITTIKFCACW